MVEGLREEVRSELGILKRVQLGQVERKWEDHPQAVGPAHTWG